MLHQQGQAAASLVIKEQTESSMNILVLPINWRASPVK
jgi:hypothetical protein